ncbi:MAG TPA: CHAT domain-containing tetratricopeptide repeat protein [Acidothermaceae bacterium]|nr:CHAT domain-containing tetratricopeptide repeat protein [Acidothermaceae bacterium]
MSVTKQLELTQLQRRAEAVYAQVPVAPARAEATARRLIGEAKCDPTAQVMAMRALALTVRLSAGPNESIKILREAVRLGERRHLGRCLAEARMTYAALLADVGRISTALAECDRAAEVLKGKDAGPLLAQRALILARAGRSEEAMSNFARALPLLRAANDIHFQCLLYINRSNLLAYLGRLGAAERDLQSGIALARTHGLHDRVVVLSANLGFLKVRGGDIPAALRLFAEALEGAGNAPRLVATHDRAEALLVAGMPGEARESLEQRVDDVERAGFAVDLAEWHLLLAQAALMEGEAEVARASAERARTEFRAQGRARWALLAQQLVIRARWASGERTTALSRAARDAYAKLWTAGWQVAALHCLVVAGRIELEAGHLASARTDLARAAQARRRGPADLRAAAWYAEAMLRLASRDTRGATTALKAGLRVVDDHAASLGATDLRVHATGLGTDLAEQGVRLAVESGKPVAVLEWIERFRAGTLRRRPVRPPSDARLAGELADLRRVTAELAQTTADGEDSRGLRAEQLRLEEAVRHRSRHARGTRAPVREFDVDELRAAVGERAFVEILRVDDAMLAVTLVDSKLRLHELGSYPDAMRELESLRFSLHRLARKHGSATSLAAARLGFLHAAESLDALLMRPVLDVIGDREVVLVPTGQLHALPWPTLPSLRGRPVSVAPSATTWLAAMRANSPTRARARRRVVLVAGPNLEHAEPEVAALAKLYDAPQILTGADATADVVRQAIDGAELVHIAAHGRFRADNPQFSAIELADGPLTVYDLERMRRGPRRLVLSACDSGLSAVHAGDELMGLVGAVFSLGTSTLIASVVPVADDLTEALMVELHDELCAGATPAHALATAQTRVQVDGFVCFGAA